MIVEERTYTAGVGQVKEWLDYYHEHAWPLQLKYLGRCIGFFTTEIGELNKVVHLWAYDDLAHRERARKSMMQDPAWQAYLAGQPKVLVHQETRILNPTSFSPLK